MLNNQKKHCFIIAGEASGDEHAAALVRELSQKGDGLEFSGIGGDKMQAAGVNLLYPLAQYGVTGFTEVLKQFKHIRTAFNLAKKYIKQHAIDLVILVDYPGFNLRFAKVAHKQGIKVLYYISPQIWAWKAKRVTKIKQYVDVMAVILPFEKPLYQKQQIPAFFVGNPLTQHCQPSAPKHLLKQKFSLNAEHKIIGLLPGSRINEVARLLPVMLTAAKQLNQQLPTQLTFVLPVAPTIQRHQLQEHINLVGLDNLVLIEQQQSIDIMACCDALVIASGTATLQATLLGIPMVLTYQVSRLTYLIATQVIKCRYIGLANLIAQKMVIPELIQDDLTADHIRQIILKLLSDDTYYQCQAQKLKKVSKMLENKSVDCRLPHLVLSMLEDSAAIKDIAKRN